MPKAKKDLEASPPIPEDVHKWAEDDLFTFNDYIVLLTAINDLAENPVGNCSDVEIIELPTKPHIYTKSDIEDIREKLEEFCFYPPERGTEWEDFWTELKDIKDPGQLWTADVLNEIEDAIDEGWCDCCVECANARDCSERWTDIPFVDSGMEQTPESLCGYTFIERWADKIEESEGYPNDHGLFGAWQRHWLNEYIDVDANREEAVEHALRMNEAGADARKADTKWNKWRTLQAGFQVGIDWFEEQLERAQERLEELQEIHKAVCKLSTKDKSHEGACEKAQEHIDDQMEHIEDLEDGADEIEGEHDRLEGLADEQMDEMESAAGEHQSLQESFPVSEGRIRLFGLIPNVDSIEEIWLGIEPPPVIWDYPWWTESVEPCRVKKPRDLKTWLNLIAEGEDDDILCWAFAPNWCSVNWSLGVKFTGGYTEWVPPLNHVGGWEALDLHDGGTYLSNGMWVRSGPLIGGHANDYHRSYIYNSTYGWWDTLSSGGDLPYGGADAVDELVCPNEDDAFNPRTQMWAYRIIYNNCICPPREAEPTEPSDKDYDAPPWWETYTGDDDD